MAGPPVTEQPPPGGEAHQPAAASFFARHHPPAVSRRDDVSQVLSGVPAAPEHSNRPEIAGAEKSDDDTAGLALRPDQARCCQDTLIFSEADGLDRTGEFRSTGPGAGWSVPGNPTSAIRERGAVTGCSLDRLGNQSDRPTGPCIDELRGRPLLIQAVQKCPAQSVHPYQLAQGKRGGSGHCARPQIDSHQALSLPVSGFRQPEGAGLSGTIQVDRMLEAPHSQRQKAGGNTLVSIHHRQASVVKLPAAAFRCPGAGAAWSGKPPEHSSRSAIN